MVIYIDAMLWVKHFLRAQAICLCPAAGTLLVFAVCVYIPQFSE